MKAEIIDKNGHIKMAVNSMGIQVDQKTLEVILNMSDFVRRRVEQKRDRISKEISCI